MAVRTTPPRTSRGERRNAPADLSGSRSARPLSSGSHQFRQDGSGEMSRHSGRTGASKGRSGGRSPGQASTAWPVRSSSTPKNMEYSGASRHPRSEQRPTNGRTSPVARADRYEDISRGHERRAARPSSAPSPGARSGIAGTSPLHSSRYQREGQREQSSPSKGGPSLESVIFLDIDGVLHSLYGNTIFKDSCLCLLEKIVRATKASIVLSSTWRLQDRSTAMVNQMLRSRHLAPIVDRTKDLSAIHNRHVPREAEVTEWLDRHPQVQRWIAIDDIDLQCGHTEDARRLRGHFVHTNPMSGLVPPNADLAIRLMEMQRPSRKQDDRHARPLSRGRVVVDTPMSTARMPYAAHSPVGRATVGDFVPRVRSFEKASARQRISR